MILWIDAQLSPNLAPWIIESFGIETEAVRDIGLHNARDLEIFLAARDAGAVVVTKDSDFIYLIERRGPPPQVIWLTCGNSSNYYLRGLLERTLPQALTLLEGGQGIVEISDAVPSEGGANAP